MKYRDGPPGCNLAGQAAWAGAGRFRFAFHPARPKPARTMKGKTMAESSPLAGLLDRAGHVFSLAGQLGESFHERAQFRASLFDPSVWEAIAPTFDEFCAALLDLRDTMQHPPDNFAPVAQTLLEAARIAREIRAKVKSEDDLESERGRWNGHSMGEILGVRSPGPPAFTVFGEFSDRLSEVCNAGREEVNKARRLADPFAFVDQLVTGKDAGIDTTPTLPRPRTGLIESAAREIPGILANVEPSHNGAIELIASHLAKRLQDAKHTLAAAHWAIHESIQAGRLHAGLVEVGLPSVGTPGPGGMVWSGSGWGTIAIPKGKPAPFDAFKAAATESLWTWWRSLDAAESSKDESPADAGQFIERLLAGPGDVELTPREMALLEAYLGQPISFSAIQREKRATGHSQTQANRNKLKLIRDFNRGLQQANAPTDAPAKQREAGPALDPTPAELTAAKPTDHPSIALLSVFTNGVSDDRINQASQLLADDLLTANEKLTKIDSLMPFPATASAEQLGELLGVTKQAVLKTDWWVQNRKGEKEGEIGRRRAGHQKRSKEYEKVDLRDDDE